MELLIFDLDGTLIDSKNDIAACVNHVFTAFGIAPVGLETVARHVGTGVQPLIQEVFDREGKDASGGQKAFLDCYLSHVTETTRLYDGIRSVLNYYRDKPKVILTNKRQVFTDKILENLSLRPYFKNAYGREAFAQMKPHPLPIVEICKAFGTAPKDTAMIGDTYVDVLAGNGAGAFTVGALYGYGDEGALRAAGPRAFVQRPKELCGLFD